jgi:hypothetical protein
MASRIEIKIDQPSQKIGDISQKALDFLFLLQRGDGVSLMGRRDD